MTVGETGLEALGWDAGWAASFAPFAAEGRRPGRVVAVHRETSIVRDEAGDRSANVSGAFRFAALGHVDFPTVGDWVALEGDVIGAILPRRSVFKRMASDATRRGARLDDEQIMAANIDVALLVAGLDNDFNLRRIERYLAVAWSSEISPVVVLNKSDLADDVDGRLVAVDAIAPGVATVAVSARTGAGLDALRAHLRPGHDRRDPGLVGRRQVDARQRAPRGGSPGDGRGPRLRLARPPHDHPSRAVRAARRGAAGRHARHPLARGPRRRRGRRGRLRRRRRHRRDLPVQRLPARRRAGLRGPGRARRRPADRGPPGQPPQARARGRAGRRARPTRGPGPSTAATGRSSTSR